MAKKFFYVCAGLFLLALSYHLGIHAANAQTGGVAGLEVQSIYVSWASGGTLNLVVNGPGGILNRASMPLPRGGVVLSTWAVDGGVGTIGRANVVYDDGGGYYWDGTSWSPAQMFNSPTGASSATWGQVKSTYRK